MSEPTFLSDHLPYPFDGQDVSAFKKHKKGLVAARKLAKKKPLYSGLLLDCTLSIPRSDVTKAPGARSLPHFASDRASGVFTLRLGYPLQSGENMSQVWYATVEGQTSAAEVMPSPIVMKFIQPSLCEFPDLHSELPWYRPPEMIAKCEAEFYGLTEDLQGSVIPYFFWHSGGASVLMFSLAIMNCSSSLLDGSPIWRNVMGAVPRIHRGTYAHG